MAAIHSTKASAEEETSSDQQKQKPHMQLTQLVEYRAIHPDDHPLEYNYVFSYFMRPQQGKFDPEDYAMYVQPVAKISSVEQFWQVYRFIKRPSDISEKVDFHLFKENIKPVWEDPANMNGGKWILRLKKGLSSRIWENLLLAMIGEPMGALRNIVVPFNSKLAGEQFLVGDEVVGAVCSVRNQEDIVSLWNRTASSLPVTNRIRDTLKRVLNLPANAIIEYKRHDDCLRDQRSYCHTSTSAQQLPQHATFRGGGAAGTAELKR